MYGIIKHEQTASDLAPVEGQGIILTNIDILSITDLETNPVPFDSNYNSFHEESKCFVCMMLAILFRPQFFVIGKSRD